MRELSSEEEETDAGRQTAGEHDTRGSLRPGRWRERAVMILKLVYRLGTEAVFTPRLLATGERCPVFGRSSERPLCARMFLMASKPRGFFFCCCRRLCSCCATVWDFILKILLRWWERKATSNIWKELLLFISFFYEILQQEAWGRCGQTSKRAVAF